MSTATSVPGVTVVDDRDRHALPTGRVKLRIHAARITGMSDDRLAQLAGYDPSRHYGYALRWFWGDDSHRHVTVELHND